MVAARLTPPSPPSAATVSAHIVPLTHCVHILHATLIVVMFVLWSSPVCTSFSRSPWDGVKSIRAA
eukprot:5322565-Amphidinium_carterae.1